MNIVTVRRFLGAHIHSLLAMAFVFYLAGSTVAIAEAEARVLNPWLLPGRVGVTEVGFNV